MASIFGTESFESGSSGAAITSANTGFTSVQAGWSFTATPAPPTGLGPLAAQVTVASGSTSYAQATFTGTPIVVPRMYVRFPSMPATGSVDLAAARGGGTARARLGIVDGHYVMRNGSTVVWTSSATAPTGQWNRLEWFLDNSAGTQQLRIFRGANVHGTVPDEASPVVTFTAGTQVDVVRFGPAQAALSASWTAFYDAIVISDTTWPGPGYLPGSGGTGTTPTVNAGTDQVGVTPWSTVTLTAVTTGTVSGVSWSQTQGPPVALTATADPKVVMFEAPGLLLGASLRFQAEALFASGSVVDSVDVTVLAVTNRAVIGGQEVPMRVYGVGAADVPLAWRPDAPWLGPQPWGEH